MAPLFTLPLSTPLQLQLQLQPLHKHSFISHLPTFHSLTTSFTNISILPKPLSLGFSPKANPTNNNNGGPTTTAPPSPPKGDERVQKVHSVEEFDAALLASKEKLVVVEYATRKNEESRKIYPFMVELSRTCNDVEFILVMGDESDETRQLCLREGVTEVPHFSFYKSMQKIHDEAAVGPDMLAGDVLYYGDSHSGVVQLHSGEDVRKLLNDHRDDGKLVVLDVGLKHCGPCVKVYPTVVKLSKQMENSAVFARMNGDENESCMQFLRDMNVVEVPTFLFIKNGNICGRYVGSGKGELIGEILRYQGVRVTY